MAQPTAKHQLIEARLGQSLASFIEARRPHTSWRRLAHEIYQRTQIDVSDESLRNWSEAAARVA